MFLSSIPFAFAHKCGWNKGSLKLFKEISPIQNGKILYKVTNNNGAKTSLT